MLRSGRAPQEDRVEGEFTFGIEEEYFLFHTDTGRVARRLPDRLWRAVRERFGAHVSHELLQSQVEASTPVLQDCDQALRWLGAFRAGLREQALPFGLAPLAAGTHPLAEWREQSATDKPRYERLLDDFQIVAQRNLLCGLHVHVAVPAEVDRIALMNRCIPWLPLLLALSVSSPFWNKKRTGLMSYRQAAYDEWPRTGIPDYFENEREYQSLVDLLVQTGSLRDASSIWWAIRPSARFPTLELRVCDACPDLRDAVCIAGLYRALVRALVLDPELGAYRNRNTRLVAEENRWRAKRYGIEASFIDPVARRTVPAAQAIEEWLALLAPHATALGCEGALRRARDILATGTSATRQLAWYRAARDAGQGRRAAGSGRGSPGGGNRDGLSCPPPQLSPARWRPSSPGCGPQTWPRTWRDRHGAAGR